MGGQGIVDGGGCEKSVVVMSEIAFIMLT